MVRSIRTCTHRLNEKQRNQLSLSLSPIDVIPTKQNFKKKTE